VSPRLQFALALALDLAGSAGVLLLGARDWQTIVTPRGGGFLDDTLQVTGRSVDAAPTAMGLVALAGAVAVIATRGAARRAVGVVIALAGAGILWRTTGAMSALSTSRARDLVRAEHPTATSATALVRIATHDGWAIATIAAAVLILAAGLLVAGYGGRWTAMSSRYESPAAQADPEAVAARRARADTAMWAALDQGDDPTERDPHDIR
jgi:uncharacterized membrane protein (TIGR02234 family)